MAVESPALRIDAEASQKGGLKEKLTAWALNHLPLIFAILLNVKPNLVFKTFSLVTRFRDAQEVMLDGRELTRPRRSDIDRPKYQYLYYGYGMHTCFGRHINDVQIASIVKALLVKDNLQRAAGDAGKLTLDARSSPTHLNVTMTP